MCLRVIPVISGKGASPRFPGSRKQVDEEQKIITVNIQCSVCKLDSLYIGRRSLYWHEPAYRFMGYRDREPFNLHPVINIIQHDWVHRRWNQHAIWNDCNRPLTRYVKLRVAHAPGMPATFPPPSTSEKPLVSDPGMHHGTCFTHAPWCMSGLLTHDGGENVPGIPGACATRNFEYLERGPWRHIRVIAFQIPDYRSSSTADTKVNTTASSLLSFVTSQRASMRSFYAFAASLSTLFVYPVLNTTHSRYIAVIYDKIMRLVLTNHTPHLALPCQLWGVFRELYKEKWQRYIESAL